MNSCYSGKTVIKLLKLTNSVYNIRNNASDTKNSGIKTSTSARERVWTQGTSAREYVSALGTLAREHVSTQGTLVREHVSTQGTLAREHVHCVKSVQIYSINLRIQSECRKILTRKNSVSGHFSRSGKRANIKPF